jgi:hypothetical protein
VQPVGTDEQVGLDHGGVEITPYGSDGPAPGLASG